MDSSDVTAVAATVTAVAALAVAVWDNVQQRQLAQRSVMPLLTATYAREGDEGSLTVENQGVGPALVREMLIDRCDTPDEGPFSIWGSCWNSGSPSLRREERRQPRRLLKARRRPEWARTIPCRT